MFTPSKTARVAMIILSFGGVAASTTFADAGPRRAEVNERLARQSFRINRELASGKITGAYASMLHQEDRSILKQERFDAKFDNGHITRFEQKALNQELNGVSKQIN